jgi:acyl-CoA hydrolase
MDNYTIVRPEHLNHHGFLFGGTMLSWVDEYAWLAATLDFPHCRLVTIAMDRSVFRHPAPVGSILRFHCRHASQGDSSVTYAVDVYADAPGAEAEEQIFSTTVTFVRVDENGAKCSLPAEPTGRA